MKKVARIELSFKIEVVCARASVFSTISTFLNVKKPKMSFILTFQELNYPLPQNFPPKLWKNEKNVAIS